MGRSCMQEIYSKTFFGGSLQLWDKCGITPCLQLSHKREGLSKGKNEGEDRQKWAEAQECTSFVGTLRNCAKNRDLGRGIKVHDDILRNGLLEDCLDALITMYAKCGELAKAKELFDTHKSRDVITWTALIAACAQKDQGHDALSYFEKMQHEGLFPDAATFTCALKACGSIGAAEWGEKIHEEIAKQGLLGINVVLGTALINMYAKCRALSKARRVLDELPVRDVVAWNALMAGYAQQGEGEQVLHCFERMAAEGISPDAFSFSCILKACGSIRAADVGEKIHEEIAKQGLLRHNNVLGTVLIDMYSKCGALAKAWQVLDEFCLKDVTAWNALIAGYVQQGEGEQALRCYDWMQHKAILPDAVTFICILKACGSIKAVAEGQSIHDEIAKRGLLANDIVLGSNLVDMYAKCGALEKAEQVLKELPVRNVISWNALIAGYLQYSVAAQALKCYEEMQNEGICPDAMTFTCILRACGSVRAAEQGVKIHHEMDKQGLLRDHVVLGTALVDMYVKCGALTKSQQVLEELPVRNALTWTALIAGYAEQGDGNQALNCFEKMQREGLSPDPVTFMCILKACGTTKGTGMGEKIHDEIAKQGLLKGSNVMLGTALVDMYVKCGALPKARKILEELPMRDVISWNAIIAGYAMEEENEEALNCFEGMQGEGLSPDAVTFCCVLKACGSIGAVDNGEKIHEEIAKQGMLLGSDVALGTALVDMYANCGALAKARQVLDELPIRSVSSWTALIAGHAQQCKGVQALTCFEQMQGEGLFPDAATLLCVLSACSRLSLVENASTYFAYMSTKYGMKPDPEHYGCIIDLLGRAGQLDRAVGMIENMPGMMDQKSCTDGVWSALLSASMKWGDVEIGRWAFENTRSLDYQI